VQSVKERMRGILAKLEAEYDFDQFTMESFRSWLEQQRGKEITFVPWTMPPGMSGAWLTSAQADFVFYEQDTAPIHQIHIQLHEIAHMLCEHPTVKVGTQEVSLLFRQMVDRCVKQETQSLLLRSAHSGEAEIEAETLASLIQETVLKHERLQELSQATPAPDLAADFGAYLEKMDGYAR